MKRWAGWVQALESLSFLVMAALHAGVQIPLGLATLTDVGIRAAVPFETLCGVVLAVAAYAALAGRRWAWTATVGAQAVSMFFVLIGLYFVGFGRGGGSPVNTAYHEVMAVALLLGLGFLLLPHVQERLRA
jgi:hypothetical protein